MGLILTETRDTPTAPVFIKIHTDFAGGGTLDKQGFKDGDVIQAGANVEFDEATRLVKVLKTAIIHENAAAGATSYKIKKSRNEQPHGLVRTDVIAAAVGGLSYAISADVDMSAADYDTITVGTSLGALSAGDIIFHSAASGATAGKLKVAVNGVLKNNAVVGKNEFVAVARECIVYNRRIPYATPQAVKDANKGTIIYSEQR